MAGRAEFLFGELKDRAAVAALIGEPEDGHLDVKRWPEKEKDAQAMLAKAVCGFANSDGGVLVIGMDAPSTQVGEADLITALAPVSNASHVRSRILSLIGNLIEPSIAGLETREIAEADDESGFVVVYVPRMDGAPHRSRKDRELYVRVGSITQPMEYWQLEDRFGSRPHPKLIVNVKVTDTAKEHPFSHLYVIRQLLLSVTNVGRGLARFPAVLYKPSSFGYAQNMVSTAPAWPVGTPNAEWLSFRGGADNVIYPGESIDIVELQQLGQRIPKVNDYGKVTATLLRWDFPHVRFVTNVVCDGMPMQEQIFDIPSYRHVPDGSPYSLILNGK